MIECILPERGSVQIEVFSMQGRMVDQLTPGMHSSGNFTFNYNARPLSDGVYVYKIKCGSFELKSKMVVLR
jgi:hypothetical protein